MGKMTLESNDGLSFDEQHAYEQSRGLFPGEAVSRVLWDEQEAFRFIKVSRNVDGSFFVIAGAFALDGTPIVCMASGDSLRAAMQKFRSRSEAAHWQRDKFAADSDTGIERWQL